MCVCVCVCVFVVWVYVCLRSLSADPIPPGGTPVLIDMPRQQIPLSLTTIRCHGSPQTYIIERFGGVDLLFGPICGISIRGFGCLGGLRVEDTSGLGKVGKVDGVSHDLLLRVGGTRRVLRKGTTRGKSSE